MAIIPGRKSAIVSDRERKKRTNQIFNFIPNSPNNYAVSTGKGVFHIDDEFSFLSALLLIRYLKMIELEMWALSKMRRNKIGIDIQT